MNPSSRWNDLSLRVITGGALLALGLAEVWIGGTPFAVIVALVVGITVLELAGMVADLRGVWALALGALACACIIVSREIAFPVSLLMLSLPALAGAIFVQRRRTTFAVFAFCIVVAGYGLTEFRDERGAILTLWLVSTVVASDIAGYFGGRMIGGRKLWLTVSPGKTWAGTVSGWLATSLVGLGFALTGDAGFHLVWISVLVGFASQAGDLVQSALKRRVDVKDSGELLPGHGGFFDRFDSLLGAALFVTLAQPLWRLPLL